MSMSTASKTSAGVEVIFLRSVAVMVSLPALVLAYAEEAAWPAAFTPLVVLAAHIVVDRRKYLKLSVTAANLLGVIAFLSMAYEFYDNNLLGKLLAGAHLLVYMTWVVLLMQKGIRQFWWLATLSVLQVSVASVLTTNPTFGALLVLTLLVMIWTLSVFTLYRVQLRMRRSDETATGGGGTIEDSLSTESDGETAASVATVRSTVDVRNGLHIDSDEPWVGWRFCGIVSFAFVSSLFVGLFAFAVFPRVWVNEALGGISELQGAIAHRTGFTESVELGEIGQIMQSDQRVQTVEFTTVVGGKELTPDEFATHMNMDEVLFRGNAMGHYRNGRWRSGGGQSASVGDLETRRWFRSSRRQSDFRVRITQDPPIATFAFAPLPADNVVSLVDRGRRGSKHGQIEQRMLSYALVHSNLDNKFRAEPLTYEVWCSKPPNGQKHHLSRPSSGVRAMLNLSQELLRPLTAFESFESVTAKERCITRDLASSLPSLTKLAIEVCSNEDGQLVSERRRVDSVLAYLNSAERFQYSLAANVIDDSVDPVEDFLLNRKSGHCEYFASAAALMLQAVGVPARIVNGYKGCEENSVTGRWEVKQKHAHTWLEAYVHNRWETVDPTPAAAREEGVAQPSTLSWWMDLKAAFADNWFSIVQKMSLQQQEAMAKPLVDSVKNAVDTIRQQGLWAALKMFYEEVILQPKKWVSWQTGAVTFFLLLILGLAIQRRPDHILRSALGRLFRWLRPGRRGQQSVVRFYETFCSQCERHGLKFPNNQTAQENALMAIRYFSGRLSDEEDRRLPTRIAHAFNRVRFGQAELGDDAVAGVRSDVGRFTELLSGRATEGT